MKGNERMASKRMFTKQITETDEFLDMPLSTQCLYFHLNMGADDEGFVSSPKRIIRMIGARDDDLKVLVAKRYILPFESGICVIKHWKMHNAIRSDRVKSTTYAEEKALLDTKENGSYTEKIGLVDNPPHLVDNLSPSLDKVSIGEYSIDKYSKEEENIVDAEIVEKVVKVKKKEPYFDNEEVNTLFLDFLDLRKKIKAKNTDNAIKLLTNKLNKYDDQTKIQMISNSIMNSWKGVFEPTATKGVKQSKVEKPEWFDEKIEKQAPDEEAKKRIDAMLKKY